MSKTTYLDFLDGVKSYYDTGLDQWVEIAKYGLKDDNVFDILSQVPDVNIIKNADGTVRGITYKGFTSWGGHNSNIGSNLNSNTIGGSASANKSFNMNIPSNTKIDESTKQYKMVSEIGNKVSTGEKIIGVLGTIRQAVLAVGTACTLGKTLDKALYNLNPDFWNAHDMETLDPDTWSSITNSGSLGETIFNILMGVDPDTNETTAYVDQNAFAYMALYLQQKKIFDETLSTTVNESKMSEYDRQYYKDQYRGGLSAIKTTYGNFRYQLSEQYTTFVKSSSPVLHFGLVSSSSGDFSYVLADELTNFDWNYKDYSEPTTLSRHSQKTSTFLSSFEFYFAEYTGGGIKNVASSVPVNIENTESSIPSPDEAAYFLTKYGEDKKTSLDGVGTQDDATVPDLSGASTIDDVLNILKSALPFLFNNAITNSVPQEDGTVKDYTYIPITLPNTNNNNDTQPETGGQTQSKPQVNPDTSPDTLLDLITKLLGTKPNTPNPPETGKGNTPDVILPTGSASALFKIYNPSQSELNSFGEWLWSSNFVDQLLKVFNNPMESLIGLHKVYASPVIGGTSNIKVGYLDSGVSSNFVSNQYTKIDCGTVNIQEYFGNVFDYAPYTAIELYLPCIGFVQLDVANVMRSSINITYTVDVLTGACLAEVNVKRDNSGGVLYSYSGNCASQYPLSSGSYMGILSSVIGVAGSIVGTVASGGSLAPLALGATSGLLNAKTRVQHSGSLSGNSGVMGGKIPYLIITRPQTNMAENFEHYQGLPSNVYSKLSSCSGFVKVKNVNVQNINAESAELDEIKTLLLDGVII